MAFLFATIFLFINIIVSQPYLQPVEKFVNALSTNWGYAIPSDNLWVIEIKTHNRGLTSDIEKSSFADLYSNIMSVNANYKSRFANSVWGVDLKGTESEFISGLDKELKLFLASEVAYSTNQNTITGTANASLQQYGGFLSQGKVLMARASDLEAKVTFMSTNWDINEIFIDPWIAAIAQQGLIESSELPNIKADINIYEFASSHPSNPLLGDEMIIRKEINLIEAFPKSREETKMSYELGEAGTVKTQTVSFAYRDYKILYHLGFGAQE